MGEEEPEWTKPEPEWTKPEPEWTTLLPEPEWMKPEPEKRQRIKGPKEYLIDWNFGDGPFDLCVNVGDTVVFEWDNEISKKGKHNVIKLANEKAYMKCEDPAMTTDGVKLKDRISHTMTSEGTFFYACGNVPPAAPKKHCFEGGMKAKIQVGNCSK